MLLAVGPLAGFAGFLQILLWILIPLLGAAIVTTIAIHYGRPRKELEQGTVEEIVASNPEQSGYRLDNDQYVVFDHSGLIKEYKTRLVNHHAKYSALKQDYSRLELKYNSLLLLSPVFNDKNINMENNLNPEQFPAEPASATSIDIERKELQARFEQLNQAYQQLEKENESLLEKISLLSTLENGKDVTGHWVEENRKLKEKLADQECINDLLTEKKSEVEFLQQQLETRIRNYHRSEQQLAEVSTELDALKQSAEQSGLTITSLQEELQTRNKESEEFLQQLENKEKIVEEKELLILSNSNQITYLEGLLQELREQNEMLNAAANDGVERSTLLEKRLEDEQVKITYLQNQLSANKKLLHRLYSEFSSCMQEADSQANEIKTNDNYESNKVLEEESLFH